MYKKIAYSHMLLGYNTGVVHWCIHLDLQIVTQHVGNKAKVESQNSGYKKTKHANFFRKTNISYPLTRIRTCAYQGVRNVSFSENLACFVFL